ncbi:RNA methyltransferase [Thiohalocapsa marina]|uniref:tRNA (cytidine/uridine-2'-O-)-methyltransferase TrmJ n=1 Tax=Thiohalocapsa marina TaxID=424902 RepID=A0A5M8FR72_9GAMM|nr:RNA methyltransferase [Thiohalocapsa marina]KAA6183652.1 RNA methyltransferase [Thiohalocapsa marina]
MDRTAQSPLARIRFVLVETSLSGNIGAVARAMKTMGLARMELVRPRRLPDAEAVARASGADDLLARAGVHQELAQALTGCRLVVGSSARLRSVEWPQLDPAACGQRLVHEALQGDVALVFGRESSGLTNDELGLCHYLAHIDSDAAFSSLNIGAAAQVFAYEIRRSWLNHAADAVAAGTGTGTGAITQAPTGEPPATADEMEGFYTHLRETLVGIGFADPDQSKRLLRRLRRLFNRARPDHTELNILRGILSAAQGRKAPGRFMR